MCEHDGKESLNAQLMFELGVVNLNWQKWCDYIGIPVNQRYNPNCADWMIKWHKENQVRVPDKVGKLFSGSATPENLPDITKSAEENPQA